MRREDDEVGSQEGRGRWCCDDSAAAQAFAFVHLVASIALLRGFRRDCAIYHTSSLYFIV